MSAAIYRSLMVERCLDVADEQRMTIPWRALELGVELHTHEPRMHRLRQFNDFGELFALRDGRDNEPRRLQPLQVMRIRLVAVAVPFGHHVAVDLMRNRAWLHVRTLCPQAHGATHIRVG